MSLLTPRGLLGGNTTSLLAPRGLLGGGETVPVEVGCIHGYVSVLPGLTGAIAAEPGLSGTLKEVC